MKGVVFLGPPGSGKGTQSALLSKEFRVPLIGMGDLVRKEIELNTELGKKIRLDVESGGYPSSEEVIGLLKKFLINSHCSEDNLVLLDGVPRSLEQVFQIREMIPSLDITHVIFLDVSPDDLMRRILMRRQCVSCGKPFLSQDTACFFCGSHEFCRRVDDDPEVFQKRLSVYKENVQPLLDFYRSENILFELNGALPPQELFEELKFLFSKI